MAATTTATSTPTPTSTTAATTTATSSPTSTTAAPTTTTSTPTTASSTAAPTTTTSTEGTPSSGPSSSATSATTSNPNPDATGLCREKSCFGGSSCVNLNMSHFCLCIDGYYYNSSQCNKGKVLPGTIKVKMSEISGLKNETSKAYEILHKKITKFFADVFLNDDYGQTVIYKVRLSALARSEMRAGDKLVDVEVVNIFAENSKQNEMTVSEAINKRISNNSTDFASYTKQDRCEFYGCVKNNVQDDCSDGLLCKCKEGLERPNPQIAMCIALGPKCVDTCKAEHNMQCVVKSDGTSDCVCLPGYQRDDNKKCQACAFGYSGVDCKDDFQLILTVVGTIAGILVLGMVIALICTRSKTSKNIEEQNLIENDFQRLRLQYMTGFSNPGTEGRIFPRVRTNFPNSQPGNPYAQRSMPRPDY
ncbi:mucin-13-like [Molossus nigricans]